jgi:phosphoglycolate phosphatase
MTSTKLTICFDLDGTLVNSAPDLFSALDHALQSKGYDKSSQSEIRPIIGQGAKAMIKRALNLKNIQLNDTEIDELWHILIDHYTIHSADQTHPFEGTVKALENLQSEGHILAVCTNKTIDLTLPLLEKLDLTKHFKAITGADSFSYKKPDARHLFETIKQAGGDAKAAVMIGDSKTDIQTATNASIPSIGVTWGYTDIPMPDLNPTHLINHFDELTNVIEKIAS